MLSVDSQESRTEKSSFLVFFFSQCTQGAEGKNKVAGLPIPNVLAIPNEPSLTFPEPESGSDLVLFFPRSLSL